MSLSQNTAITYKTTLDLSTILTAVGDSIKIFVPAPCFVLENNVFSEQLVFGSRPYSIQSDIVAVCAHMGVLFPCEKSKKNVTDILLTSPNVPIFGRGSHHDETRKIDGNFRVTGALLNVIAVPPPESYPSVRGVFITSQHINDDSPVAIDILDYSFITEFEGKLEIVDDPLSIVKHETPQEFFTPISEDELLTYDYSPELFACDKEGDLLKDFKVIFYVDEKAICIKWNKESIVAVELSNEEEEGKEDVIAKDLQYKDIQFGADFIKVGDTELKPIGKVMLLPPDGENEE